MFYVCLISSVLLIVQLILLHCIPLVATYLSPIFILVLPGIQLLLLVKKSPSIYGMIVRIILYSTCFLLLLNVFLVLLGKLTFWYWFSSLILWPIFLCFCFYFFSFRSSGIKKFVDLSGKELSALLSSILHDLQIVSPYVLVPLLLLLFIAGSLFIYSSRVIVPPLLDQDFDTEGTAWGLLHHFLPYCVSDRSYIYHYAHPLLFHFYIGYNALSLNRLGELQEYFTISHNTEKKLEEYKKPLSVQERAKFIKGDLIYMLTHFNNLKDKSHSRGLSIFFSLMTITLLYLSMVEKNGFSIVSIFMIVYLFTTPEYVVRSSYGGYMAISLCFLTLALLLEYRYSSQSKELVMLGIIIALTNHKLAFYYVGLLVAKSLFFIIDVIKAPSHKRELFMKYLPWGAIGFFVGTMLYWVYGLTTNPDVFYHDHLRVHLFNRLGAQNFFDYKNYPTMVELWLEFFHHQGYLLLFLCVSGWYVCFRKYGQRYWSQFLPFVLGIVFFTLTDWRQTKHLMLLLPFVFVYFPLPEKGISRTILGFLCVLSIGRNIYFLYEMNKHFEYLSPTPLW